MAPSKRRAIHHAPRTECRSRVLVRGCEPDVPKGVKVFSSKHRYVLVNSPFTRFRETFYWILTLNFWSLIGLGYGGYNLLVLIFALGIMGCEGDSAPDGGRTSFRDAFNVSFHAFSTIGYGSLWPHNSCSNIVVAVEATTSVMYVSFFVGLLLAKVTRPKATIEFSKIFTISNVGGKLCLVMRVVNCNLATEFKAGELVEVDFKIRVHRVEKNENGELRLYRYNLPLLNSNFMTFRTSLWLVHAIGRRSPFYGMTKAQFLDQDMVMEVIMTGIDLKVQDTVAASKTYYPSDVQWDKRFVKMGIVDLQRNEITQDYAKLNALEDAARDGRDKSLFLDSMVAPVTMVKENEEPDTESSSDEDEEEIGKTPEAANIPATSPTDSTEASTDITEEELSQETKDYSRKDIIRHINCMQHMVVSGMPSTPRSGEGTPRQNSTYVEMNDRSNHGNNTVPTVVRTPKTTPRSRLSQVFVGGGAPFRGGATMFFGDDGTLLHRMVRMERGEDPAASRARIRQEMAKCTTTGTLRIRGMMFSAVQGDGEDTPTPRVPDFVRSKNRSPRLFLAHFGGIYQLLMSMDWFMFTFVAVLALWMSIILFALLLYAEEDSVQISTSAPELEQNLSLFGRCVFFSMQTLSTIGFGLLYPKFESDSANFTVIVENILGLFLTTLIMSITWSKASIPKPSFAWSEDVIIAKRKDGRRVLSFRAMNMRPFGSIVQCSFRVSVVATNPYCKIGLGMHDLQLREDTFPSFSHPATVEHVIDKHSPLHDISLEQLNEAGVILLVLFTGFDSVYHDTLYARHTYTCDDFADDAIFPICVKMSENTSLIDCRRLNAVACPPVL